ncbi:MAG: addiction module protein [Verrucomicrobiota bacterium]
MAGWLLTFDQENGALEFDDSVIYNPSMVTAQEIKELPKVEKLRMMELLWSDLTASSDDVASPSWHETELEKTAKRFAAGQEEPIDFTEAKAILRSERG